MKINRELSYNSDFQVSVDSIDAPELQAILHHSCKNEVASRYWMAIEQADKMIHLDVRALPNCKAIVPPINAPLAWYKDLLLRSFSSAESLKEIVDAVPEDLKYGNNVVVCC